MVKTTKLEVTEIDLQELRSRGYRVWGLDVGAAVLVIWEDGYTPTAKEEAEVLDLLKQKKEYTKGSVTADDKEKVAKLLNKKPEDIE